MTQSEMPVARAAFRLHPLSILFSMGSELRNLAVPALFVLILNRRAERGLFIQIVGVFLLGLIAAIWRYFSYRITYDASELVIRSGIIKRNERRIPYARIQSVDSKRSTFHQFFGVAEIVIQTAGGTEPEAKLSVLPVGAIDDIRSRVFSPLSAATTRDDEGTQLQTALQPASQRETVLRLGTRDLLLYGFIENRGMILILGAIGALFQFGPFEQMLNDAVSAEFGIKGPLRGFVTGLFSEAGHPAHVIWYAVAVVAVTMLIARIVSVVWAVVRLHEFTVTRAGDDLRVEYGLLTRVGGTIPLSRVQTVSTRAGIVHRLFGCVTLDVTVAQGGQVGGRAVREPLAPILPANRAQLLLHELWPDADLSEAEWQPLHARAHVRLLRSGIAVASLVSLVLYPALRQWALFVFAAMILWKLLTVRRVAANTSWTLSDKIFAVQSGWFAKTTVIARIIKVQVVALNQSLFDRRNDMAGVTAHTGGGVASVSYIPTAAAENVLGKLATMAARTNFKL